MLYLNKQDEHFIDKGNYTVKNNIITIYEDSRAVRFLINEGVLTYLGKDLQPITSPLAPYYQLNKQQTFNYAGKYETFFETQDDYTQTLSITPTGKKYNVSISASKVNGKENCRFSGQAWLENNILWMNISKDSNKEILMYIAPSHDNLGLEVFTDKFEDRFQMMFYCKGGGSLAGKYIKNTIKTDSIGVFDASTTIEDVLHILPATQIHKKIGHGEFLDDLYDDYEIYTNNNKALFTLTPNKTGTVKQSINRVLIKSPFFKTDKGIHNNSTYRDVKNAYSITRIEPTREHIILVVDEINAEFLIPKTEL